MTPCSLTNGVERALSIVCICGELYVHVALWDILVAEEHVKMSLCKLVVI
jgi:hypothetical protein